MYGRKHTEETKQKIRENRKAPKKENHPSWKGGRRVSANGYIEVHMPEHHRARGNDYVFEHIVVVEMKLGRQLEPGETVHHVDGNKQNNNPENLEVLTRSEHSRLHPNKRKGVNKTCPICGNSFYVKKSHDSIRTCCSLKCAGILFKEYFTGKPRNYSPNIQEKKEAIKKCSIG